MAVEKMKLVKVVGVLSHLDEFLSAACADGFFQPEQATQFISTSLGFEALSEENPYSTLLQKIEELASASGFKLKSIKVDLQDMNFSEDSKGYIYDLADKFAKLNDERKQLEEQLKTCEVAIEQYSHFTGLDMNLEKILNCEYIKFRFGHMPKESKIKLAAYSDDASLLFVPCSSDKTDEWGVYFAPKEKIAEVDRIFAKLAFERLRIPLAVGTPEEIIAAINENIEILRSEIKECGEKALQNWNKEESKCNLVYSQLKYLSSLFELRKFAAVYYDGFFNLNWFFYTGWIPESKTDDFEKLVKKIDTLSFESETVSSESKVQAPTKLKNKRIFRPFEYIVEMFGVPSSDDVDVTSFVAITYTVMFGLMFGDLGQGFVLAVAGFIMWKFMHMAMGKILVPCGISAMVAGTVYGSFFGYEHALDPLYHALGFTEKPVDVMDSINGMLLMAIGIGIVLLVCSMLIFMYKSIKNKRIGEALFSQNGLAGIVLYLCGVCFVLDFMGAESFLPKPVFIAGMLISILVIFFKEILIGLVDKHPDWKPESIGDFILENAFEIFEYILSFFSNTVSFLRISAFVLVHSGMMMAVFAIAKDGNIIVVILGNILVMCLEALFVSIQAMRLEYYELFSRCYSGEGRTFEPVKIN